MKDNYNNYTENFIGIDLGTTYSWASVFRNGAIEIIPNGIGERITPSIITILNDNKIMCEEETLEYEIKSPNNTIYSIKRLIGRKFDENLEEEIKKEKWPFEVVKFNDDSKPRIKIEKDNKIIYKYPEEITSLFLKKIIKSSEKYLQKKISNAVITVPHNFTNNQREATKQAAEMAGIKVLRILSEPTAASLAYGLEKKLSKLNCKSTELNINDDNQNLS